MAAAMLVEVGEGGGGVNGWRRRLRDRVINQAGARQSPGT